VSIRGYKGLKIFENFVPQFPKKEVKGCFGRLSNKQYFANPRHPCLPAVAGIFATGRIRPTADVVKEDLY